MSPPIHQSCSGSPCRYDGTWSSTFDGVGELTTAAALAAAPRGAGCPSVGVRWSTETTPLSPVYDLYESPSGEHLQQAGDSHVQQAFRSTGTLEVTGRTHSLEGFGFKDHSSGVRAWEGYHSHQFALFAMPSHTVHMIAFHGAGASQFLGVRVSADSRVPLIRSQAEGMDELLLGGNDGQLTVHSESGDTTTFRVEILQQFPITINEAGDNLNGLDWERDVPTVCVMESFARFTTADGDIGYGFLERGSLRDHLTQPETSTERV